MSEPRISINRNNADFDTWAAAKGLVSVTGVITWPAIHLLTGLWLTPDMFEVRKGLISACFDHWRHDEVVFRQPAVWVLFSGGLGFSHPLDTTDEAEWGVLQRIHWGDYGFSPGFGSRPSEAKKLSIGGKSYYSHLFSWQPEKQQFQFRVGHIAYTDNPAFPQGPITIPDMGLVK